MQDVPVPPLPPELPQIPVVFDPGPPIPAILAVVFMLVAGVVFFPLLRAYARRLERGAGGEAAAELEQLRARVAELEALHHRVAELEERVDFSERLLTQRAPDALPRGTRE
jgi:Tfp pilus assembly protein PilO